MSVTAAQIDALEAAHYSPNVIISPHNAGASTGTRARGVEIVLRNLDRYVQGRALENEAANS